MKKRFLICFLISCIFLTSCKTSSSVEKRGDVTEHVSPPVSTERSVLMKNTKNVYTLGNVEYMISNDCEDKKRGDYLYYYMDDDNFFFVSAAEFDSGTGFEDYNTAREFMTAFTDGEDITVTASGTLDYVNGIKALGFEYKIKNGDKTAFTKNLSFLYNKKVYTFSMVSNDKDKTNKLKELTDTIFLTSENSKLKFEESLASKKPIEEKTAKEDMEEEVKIIPDFFDDKETVEKYQKYYESCQYEKIFSMAKNHIDKSEPSKSDSAYKVIDILKPAMDVLYKCKLEKDDITNDAIIYCNGIKDIDSNICVAPTVKSSSNFVRFKVGFIKNDWLFFDTIYFDYGDDYIEKSFNSYDIQTDTLGGSKITEWISFDMDDEDLKKLEKAASITVRFENSENEKALDKKLTKNEVNAIKTLSKFSGIYNPLSDLLYDYQK